MALIQRLTTETAKWYGVQAGEVSNRQLITYLAARGAQVFCQSVKETGILKKEINLFGLFADVQKLNGWPVGRSLAYALPHIKATANLMSMGEIFGKVPSLLSPLRVISIWDGVTAASLAERTARKAAQIADITFNAVEVVQYAVKSGAVSLTPEAAKAVPIIAGRVLTVAGFVLAPFCLYEEVARLRTGQLVKPDAALASNLPEYVPPAQTVVRSMTPEDCIHSYIKIAMSVGYLGLSILGALTWAGIVVSHAAALSLTCTVLATTMALASYGWEKICIDNIRTA